MTKADHTYFALICVPSVRKNTVIRMETDFKFRKPALAIPNNLEAKELTYEMARLQPFRNRPASLDLIRTGSEPYAPLLINLY